MAGLKKRIGLRDIQTLQPGEIVWDSAVGGFHARRQKSTTISYIVVYRTQEGRQRWQTIGRHGSPWTPDTAREAAKRILGHVVEGADPAADKQSKRKAATVAELCDLYIADAETGRLLTRRKEAKKASTIATDKGRVERHIKPLLGNMKVAAVTQRDVDSFLHDIAAGKTATRIKSNKSNRLSRVRGGKGTATRTTGLLGAIFSYAVRHKMRADNPVRGVERFADGRRERRLGDHEYEALGNALAKAELDHVWPATIAAARFLSLTGWRSGEVLALRWADVDLPRRTATLPDTKTGRSMRPLSSAACAVLEGLTRSGDLVFPGERSNGLPTKGFTERFKGIARLANLPTDVTPHVLRHSFASMAGDLGYSEPTIAALVGHKGRSITSRYIHSADAVLLAAADAVAIKITALMGESDRLDSPFVPRTTPPAA